MEITCNLVLGKGHNFLNQDCITTGVDLSSFFIDHFIPVIFGFAKNTQCMKKVSDAITIH